MSSQAFTLRADPALRARIKRAAQGLRRLDGRSMRESEIIRCALSLGLDVIEEDTGLARDELQDRERAFYDVWRTWGRVSHAEALRRARLMGVRRVQSDAGEGT